MGSPQRGPDTQFAAVPAPARGWGQSSQLFFSVEFSMEAGLFAKGSAARFLFGTRKKFLPFHPPAHEAILAAILPIPTHSPIQVYSSVLSIYPSIHLHLPSLPFMYASVHPFAHLSSSLPPSHPSSHHPSVHYLSTFLSPTYSLIYSRPQEMVPCG